MIVPFGSVAPALGPHLTAPSVDAQRLNGDLLLAAISLPPAAAPMRPERLKT